MASDPKPVQKATREETFRCLAQDFSLDDKVLEKLVDAPVGPLLPRTRVSRRVTRVSRRTTRVSHCAVCHVVRWQPCRFSLDSATRACRGVAVKAVHRQRCARGFLVTDERPWQGRCG